MALPRRRCGSENIVEITSLLAAPGSEAKGTDDLHSVDTWVEFCSTCQTPSHMPFDFALCYFIPSRRAGLNPDAGVMFGLTFDLPSVERRVIICCVDARYRLCRWKNPSVRFRTSCRRPSPSDRLPGLPPFPRTPSRHLVHQLARPERRKPKIIASEILLVQTEERFCAPFG
jgi:hypothetical protein